jgi:hypothetical protein
VRHVNHAARVLTRAGGTQALRALPKIMASVNRTADARGTSVAGRMAVLRRSVQRVAQRPKLLRKLSQPTARSTRLGRMMRLRLRPGARGYGGYYGYAPGGLGPVPGDWGGPGSSGYSDRDGPGYRDWPGYSNRNGRAGGGEVRRITIDVPSTIIIRPRWY